jgi:hypothetical protein
MQMSTTWVAADLKTSQEDLTVLWRTLALPKEHEFLQTCFQGRSPLRNEVMGRPVFLRLASIMMHNFLFLVMKKAPAASSAG